MSSSRKLAYRLAAHLGRVNVDAMLEEISFPQLLEWAEYGAEEPFGEERQDWRIAKLTSELINFQRDRKAHPTPIPTRKFLLKFGTRSEAPQPKQTWEQQKSIAQMWCEAYSSSPTDNVQDDTPA